MLPPSVLEAVKPPRMRPALWNALSDLRYRRDPCAWHNGERVWSEFLCRYHEWEGDWAATPGLEEVGFCLLAPALEERMRVFGCIWLTSFPSLRTVEALGRIVRDPAESRAVRNQAVWTLGYRQLQEVRDELYWPPEVVTAADRELLWVWNSLPRDALNQFLPACRHSQSPELLDAFAADPEAASEAVEAFATPRLARALLSALPRIPDAHGPRIVRLVGSVLGSEAAAPLLEYARTAPYAAKVEAIFTALAVDAPRARPMVEAFLRTLAFAGPATARAAWHESHPGLLPLVPALRIARTTATIPPGERTEKCLAACGHFASLAAIEPFSEAVLYDLWRHVAWRSRDDDALATCVESHPGALAAAPFLVRPYLGALARRGRFRYLADLAREHDAAPAATWILASHGRPFLALAMRRLAAGRDVEGTAGQALALFLAGRPDLAARTLENEGPEPEPLLGANRWRDSRWANAKAPPPQDRTFPGLDEQWRLAHESDRHPVLAAIARGLPGLLERVGNPAPGADPDTFDIELLATFEKALNRDLRGTHMCIVGPFPDRDAVIASLEARGAIVMSGPFGRSDYFVAAPGADPATVARLKASGAVQVPNPLEGGRPS